MSFKNHDYIEKEEIFRSKEKISANIFKNPKDASAQVAKEI